MEKGLQLTYNVGNTIDKPYRELLGSLMYVMLCVRPDICYHVSYLGRFQQNPSEEHWQSLKRVLRYLKGTVKKKLIYTASDDNILVGYADADWASDTTDRKSISGYIFKVYGCTVSWSSKKQQTVATSSSEAEYVALSSAVSEAIWLRGILQDLDILKNETITINEDNRGCICMANNVKSKRSKHIDIRHHFIRDNVEKGVVKIESISTSDQLTDICTKSLDTKSFLNFCSCLGLYD
ncbi:secreted RxLR effector protein 161-like [Lucilia sericata]|uniref:secreted RxLR effector protein 161-like n=1 Tax=Lucilia sericata TaxID=13632 RepID=UPI0018A87F1E|nr:secreted RxLR effector protein 161-like [Lucilia sericata]